MEIGIQTAAVVEQLRGAKQVSMRPQFVGECCDVSGARFRLSCRIRHGELSYPYPQPPPEQQSSSRQTSIGRQMTLEDGSSPASLQVPPRKLAKRNIRSHLWLHGCFCKAVSSPASWPNSTSATRHDKPCRVVLTLHNRRVHALTSRLGWGEVRPYLINILFVPLLPSPSIPPLPSVS